MNSRRDFSKIFFTSQNPCLVLPKEFGPDDVGVSLCKCKCKCKLNIKNSKRIVICDRNLPSNVSWIFDWHFFFFIVVAAVVIAKCWSDWYLFRWFAWFTSRKFQLYGLLMVIERNKKFQKCHSIGQRYQTFNT